MPPKKAEEAAPPAEDDDPLAELATRALPPAFDDDALAALAMERLAAVAAAAGRRCKDLAAELVELGVAKTAILRGRFAL